MFSFTRRKSVAANRAADEQRFAAAQAESARRDARQKQAEDARLDLLDRLTNRYYLAHALAANGTTYQIGVANGVHLAIAEVLGQDSISVGYRLDHGISLTGGERCVVDVIDGHDIPVIISADTDVREPVSERLDRLHRKALKADNHPMYHVLYGERTANGALILR